MIHANIFSNAFYKLILHSEQGTSTICITKVFYIPLQSHLTIVGYHIYIRLRLRLLTLKYYFVRINRIISLNTWALAISVALLGMVSCHSNSTSTDSATSQAPTVNGVATDSNAVVPDSMPEQMEEPKQEAAKQPTVSFATTQQALDYMNQSAHAAEYAEGILPQMAHDELSYATKLLNNEYDKFLIIDKQLMRVGLFDKYGREILSYGIACARNYGTKHKKADSRTPEGFFSVEGIYDSTDWLFTDDNGHTSKVKGQFGPRFIRIKNPVSSQIGLHGTGSPRSIGSRASHGCIRVTNDNILELVKYVKPGMPVIISPSKRDKQVNDKEGYDIPMITMDPSGKYSSSYTATPVKEKETSKAKPAVTSTEESPAEQTTPAEQAPATEPAPAVPDSIA